MKKIFILFAFLSISGFAQNNINYKALIKDGSGNIVASQSITVQFSILQGVSQINVYQETHTPTTDANGMVILNIGAGTVNSGTYASIDWGSDDHYLNVQLNTGSGLVDMGTTQFMTVPYAIHSLTSSSSVTQLNDLSDGKSDDDGTNDGSSIFIGVDAGLNDDGTDNANVGVGYQTLYSNTTGTANVANGVYSLYWNTTGNYNVANGFESLAFNTTGSNNIANGFKSLNSNTSGSNNTANGSESLISNTTGGGNVAIGEQSLYSNTTGYSNSAIGVGSLYSNTAGNSNTAIGYALSSNETGSNNTAVGSQSLSSGNGSNNTALGFLAGATSSGNSNVFLGYSAGLGKYAGNNLLYIENSDADTDNALIYGEFGTDNTTAGNILRINGELQLGNSLANRYVMPTADGTTNQIMQTDGSGAISWIDAPISGAQKINDLSDAKSDDDGTNDGSSVFIGVDAGLNDDGTDNKNVGIGFESLKANTSGFNNVANGYWSLKNNTAGLYNTAIGYQSLFFNTTSHSNTALGSQSLFYNTTGNANTAVGYNAGLNNDIGNANIFLGFQAGYNETGSNKLYIENTDADTDNALIYGEFGTDNTTAGNILRINGELQLGNSLANRYAMPTADGTTNQIMQTDGSGAVSWIDTSSFSTNKLNDLSDAKSDDDGSEDGSSVFLGVDAGINDDSTDNRNVGVGFEVLKNNINGTFNAAYGYKSLFSNVNGDGNTAIGHQSLYLNTNNDNTAIGNLSLANNSSGLANVGIGNAVLWQNATGSSNTALGNHAGSNNLLGSSNIFLGYNSGYYEIGSNTLYIENSDADADNSLIYGEFDNDILRTNGTFQIGNPTSTGFAFPTIDGTTNQVMQTDGSGAVSWIDTSSFSTNKLNDLSDAKSDDDGSEDGSSVFIGVNSGLNDDSTDNQNVGVGSLSLASNTTGSWNTANGYQALKSNTVGYNNTANGLRSLYLNETGYWNTALGVFSGYNSLGNANVFLGFSAGFSETGSNTLYIENSSADTDNALIYGEFGTDNTTTGNILRINGELQLGNSLANRYAMPTADGTANQVMQTDGSGAVTWVDTSSFSTNKLNDLSDAKSDDDGTNDGSSVFIGVDAGLNDDLSNNKNVGIGFESLKANTTGVQNTANGFVALHSNTTGARNTANGNEALYLNSTGFGNTANGNQSLTSNGIGYYNTAIGTQALYSNKAGNQATAIGANAMRYANSTTTSYDNENVALGYNALRGSPTSANNTGNNNTAIGTEALYNNTTGESNTANGHKSLYRNTTGYQNTANGRSTLSSNTEGYNNTAIGYQSLVLNITGDNNTALGINSGYNSLGDSNIFLGSNSGYNETGSNTLYIENSDADADYALIYGEFDNNLLRINGDLEVKNSGRLEITTDTDASETPGSGSLEIANSLRFDKNEIITNTGTNLLLQYDNGGDLIVDGYTFMVDASENRIGVHTTSPSFDIHIKQISNSEGGDGGIGFERSDTSDNWKIYHSGQAISFAENGVRRAYIAPSTGVYVVTSDKRLKKDIVEVEPFLSKVNNLKTYRYLYKDQDNTAKKTLGFMAQEVQQVFPELVETNEDGYLGLNYAGFGVVAIKAIQEQQKIIESQEEKITNLEAALLNKKEAYANLNERLDKIEAMVLNK